MEILKTSWMVSLFKFVLLLAILYAGLRWFERSNLYFPSRSLAIHPGSYRLPYEEVSFKTADGVNLVGWWVPSSRGPLANRRLSVLFFHGNAGNISHRMDKLLILHRLGVNTLLFDYRGYGRSRGRPSETGTYRDGEAAYRYLTENPKIPPERIVFYGESLGSAIAVHLAQDLAVHALLLESPFSSIEEMCRLYYPWLPARWVVKYKYDNLSKISKIKAPVLVLHSPEDEIVPFQMSERLFAAAPEPKELVKLKGGHNEGFLDTGPAYEKALEAFLRR